MNLRPEVKRDILEVLKNSLRAIKENNLSLLREQSYKTVHNSSIYQDEYSISISVVMYSVFKVLEKVKYRESSGWDKFKEGLLAEVRKAILELEKDNIKGYSNSLKKILSSLKRLDKGVKMYIDDIVKSTRVKKASNIHRHGLSLGRAAELLGVSKWELMSYSGQTTTYDNKYNISKSAVERLKVARSIFKKK